MDAFTITEMHYLMVSLFCDLVWPLYLFALAELTFNKSKWIILTHEGTLFDGIMSLLLEISYSFW